jgi:hypothetical protein
LELDEGFVTMSTEDAQKGQPVKRGRGSQRKSKVLAIAESQPVESAKRAGDKPRKVGHIKMLVIADLKAATIDAKVSTHVDNGAQIASEHSTSYTNLKHLVAAH